VLPIFFEISVFFELFHSFFFSRAQIDELERIRRQQQTELEELVSSKDATGELSDC